MPIAYPVITGARASFQSTILKIDGQEFPGYAKVSMGRKRSRSMVYGNNADPLGKTRGKTEYTCKVTVYVAEFKAFILDHFGAGYGDRLFTVELTVTENGFDTMTDVANGCSVDENTVEHAEGTEGTKVELDFAPVKIYFDGIDDNAQPLQGAPA